MDFNLSSDQKEYQQEIIDFAREHLNDEKYFETFSAEMWKKVSKFGLLGVTISEEYCGLGESYLTAALIFEALGYACKNNGFVFALNNHIWVCQNLIYLYGTEQQKRQFLPKMIQGDNIGCIAISEAEAGSDAFSMKTKVKEEEDCYVLNGSKMFVSNGPIADTFIVFAVSTDKDPVSLSAFIVEKGIEGFQIGEDIKKMGLNACPTSEIVLENCRIPKNNLLGKWNQGSYIMTAALEWERCYEFAPHVGTMTRIIEECNEQATGRKQFGKPIGDNQAISNKIAQMKINQEMSQLMLYKIAWLKDQGKTAFLETSIFKVFVSEHYIQACRDALQIFGGYGYTTEYGIERELRDALACSIYSGTNEMQKNTIYRVNLINNGK